ncbi:helix-turn-helix domain-containing protein [Staphylococcus saprophyticus]|uniref:helix-turn-helix domain-containing protein n=1 Tax=Staphylococcus saprophyticus TaxID=29385 RepID=UPI002DB8D77B|nr:helix-turn-helix transcriptional regulator [Staphylococcus saprophyticus]MEB7998876.1 helix-turn-helix domain-containing protein [Staphylococcus saprophyticus]
MAKEILSKNIKKLLERKGKTQTDMAKELNLKESTVSSWLNAAKYPRRDKIELMADYFNVLPSDITDEKPEQDTIAAHFDKDGLTEDEKQEVEDFINYLKSKRK